VSYCKASIAFRVLCIMRAIKWSEMYMKLRFHLTYEVTVHRHPESRGRLPS
jgi:hypothetical protein